MLKQVKGIPHECVTCGSAQLRNVAAVRAGDSNVVTCRGCEAFMIVQPMGEEEEVAADLDRCPHCEAVDSVQEASGMEWCGRCGLDPNQERSAILSTEIAHLWHQDSGIRAHLTKNHHKPENPSGRFIRTRCGPHCVHAEKCEQSTQAFMFCFQLYRLGSEPRPKRPGEAMRHAPEMSQVPQIPSKTTTVSSAITQIDGTATACAAGGWLEKHVMGITHESSNPEGHTGTGS